jgi:mRNA interferase RelE/StbE
MTGAYQVVFTGRARRDLEQSLPESAAAAAFEFITGPLRANPHRIGKRLRGRLADCYAARRGDYRVIYQILEQHLVIVVITISHRRDAYRPGPA